MTCSLFTNDRPDNMRKPSLKRSRANDCGSANKRFCAVESCSDNENHGLRRSMSLSATTPCLLSLPPGAIEPYSHQSPDKHMTTHIRNKSFSVAALRRRSHLMSRAGNVASCVFPVPIYMRELNVLIIWSLQSMKSGPNIVHTLPRLKMRFTIVMKMSNVSVRPLCTVISLLLLLACITTTTIIMMTTTTIQTTLLMLNLLVQELLIILLTLSILQSTLCTIQNKCTTANPISLIPTLTIQTIMINTPLLIIYQHPNPPPLFLTNP